MEWGRATVLFDPEKRKAEFARIAALGVAGVKVDFWQSDKQNLIQLYYDMMRDAAAAHLLIDFHGCTLPRGWSRTWPNLVSMEAVFGAEQYKYSERMGPTGAWHNTVLVFTRNVVGPMDYTPVTLSDATYPHQTTNAHELALSVAFESGVVHFADSPKASASFRRREAVLADVPAAWDETTFVDGEPENSRSWRAGTGPRGGSVRSAGPTSRRPSRSTCRSSGGRNATPSFCATAVPKQVVSESALMRPSIA
jgi:hypothetical protein